jgi:hypothetical protein
MWLYFVLCGNLFFTIKDKEANINKKMEKYQFSLLLVTNDFF